MKARIAVLPGDGIGPEVAAEAVKVLKKVTHIYGASCMKKMHSMLNPIFRMKMV